MQRPLESGWVVQGPYVAEFEHRVAEYTDSRHAVATSSCTTALHIALAALGVKPGDEVIVPAFTWVSTANAAEYLGARPVFCDVDLDTYNVLPSAVEAAVTERTVGIVPVHLFGLPADMDPIMSRCAATARSGSSRTPPARWGAGTTGATPARSATPDASAFIRASRSPRAKAEC